VSIPDLLLHRYAQTPASMIQIQPIATLLGHQNPIYTAVCSQKSGILFTAGHDRGVVEWSIPKQAFIKILFPVQSSVYALHAPVSAPILIAGQRNGQISVFDFEQQCITANWQHHQLAIFDIQSVASKNEWIACSADGTASVWDFQTTDTKSGSYPLLQQFGISTEGIRTMAIDPSENKIAFGGKDQLIRIYNLSDYHLLEVLNGHTLPISSLQFSPDGKYLLSGSRDATLKIWDTADFSLKKSINAHLFALYSIAFHPQKPYFATASRDKSIKIWDSVDFNLKKVISINKGYAGHHLSINKLTWDPITSNLISVSDDRSVIIWDIQLD
jgi:WD40 repeat protein